MKADRAPAAQREDAERQEGAEGFDRRLETVISRYPSRQSAASTAGISVDQLAKYARQQAHPRWDTVIRLAEGAGVRLDWLAAGRGPMLAAPVAALPAVQRALLAGIIRAVEEQAARAHLSLTAEERAEMIAAIYEKAAEQSASEFNRHVKGPDEPGR